MVKLWLIVLGVFSCVYAIGKHLTKQAAAEERVRRAGEIAAAGRGALFDAVHADPRRARAVLVWRCESCDRLVFIPQDCPSCRRPVPEEVPAMWAREADVITQSARRV